MSLERRQHSRLIVNWPVLVNILQGSLEGQVKDISVGGACIFCPEEPVADENISIVLNASEKRSIAVIGGKVWSDTTETGCGTVFGMGIRFIYISPGDQQYIAELVKNEQHDLPFEPNINKRIQVHPVKYPRCRLTPMGKLDDKVCPVCGSSLQRPAKR